MFGDEIRDSSANRFCSDADREGFEMIETGQRYIDTAYPKNSVLIVEILKNDCYLVYSLELCGTIFVTGDFMKKYFHLETKS